MKTQYKYIHFKQLLNPGCVTEFWEFYNNHQPDKAIGRIKWYPHWRQYCFIPAYNTVFSVGCMNDIIDFIKQLNEKRKNGNPDKN